MVRNYAYLDTSNILQRTINNTNHVEGAQGKIRGIQNPRENNTSNPYNKIPEHADLERERRG